MKKLISAALAALTVITSITSVSAAEIKTETLKQGALGTLNSSGASYEAGIIIPGYIGQLDTQLVIDGKETDVSVSVIKLEGKAEIEVELKRFDGYIYDASLKADEYVYVPGKGFELQDRQVGTGSSSQTGGKLDIGKKCGLYSGRINFYYSMEEMKYKHVDDIPSDKWSSLYWFSLGSSYVLRLDEETAQEFTETGELDGYSWPGLRKLLIGEEDKPLYVNGSFENFQGKNIYLSGTFTDVASQWFAPYVGKVYEYGLMKGNEDATFSPQGSMTAAEAVALAARIHNIFYGMSGEFRQGTPWHEVYVGYAVERGIIKESDFKDYSKPITRRQMATMLAAAVDLTQLEKINQVDSIPDISKSDESFAVIQALYNAGVLTGSTESGGFLPSDNITRAEVAAIVARLADPSLRVSLS